MTAASNAPSERTRRPGKFVWFEHASSDPRKAQSFYEQVLGWNTRRWGDSDYDMVLAGDSMDTMIGGYSALPDGKQPHWISYVSVDDVDAAASSAAANGGEIVDPPVDMPGVGRMARIADPQGAELCLFKSAEGDPPDPPRTEGPPARQFFWNELHTTDPTSALSFYEKVLGVTHEAMEMGPSGKYYVLSRDGVGRGGVTGVLQGAPHWLPYVSVEDPDATVERATRLGGKLHFGPEDIPGVGRFAVLEDPTGAALAVMKAIPPSQGSSA